MKKIFLGLLVVLSMNSIFGQTDSIRVDIFEKKPVEKKIKPKVVHAEPLYVDLMRDLGARKGEREWNLASEVKNQDGYYSISSLVEYEFAVLDRLGLEIELPLTINSTSNKGISKPGNKIDGLKLSAMYTFLVSEKAAASMAIGYMNEFEFNEFRNYDHGKFVVGNIYNPFFVAAKRWGNDFHTLVYVGPVINHHFEHNTTNTTWEINTNFHFMKLGEKNFVGVEFNKVIDDGHFSMTIRPQARVVLSNQLILGIVTGFPTKGKDDGFSSFFRLIYEPKHKSH